VTLSVDWDNEINLVVKDHRTYKTLRDKPEATAIDLGACFDAFAKEEKIELT
jgi:hypothetical protein